MMNEVEKNTLGGGYKRVIIYDWVRLFATILVVIGHSCYLNINTKYGHVKYTLPSFTNSLYKNILPLFQKVVNMIYTFHMPLFFILSGAVFTLKPLDSFEKILKSKTKRLLIPYFLYGLLFMIPIKYLGGFYTIESLPKAINAFLIGTENSHLWFLPALFWVFVIFVILKKVCQKFNIDNPYVILFICGIIQMFYKNIPINILFFKKGMQYIFWFAMGCCFEYERSRNEKWNMKKTCLTFIILLVIELKYKLMSTFFAIICGSFMTFLFADICSRVLKNLSNSKIFKIIISSLFAVYLFHDPLEYVILRIFMNNYLLSNVFGCIIYVLLRTVGVFVISIILGKLVIVIKKTLCKILD